MDGWMDKKMEKNRWMGWIDIIEKNRWMVEWIEKIYDKKQMDGWMDRKKKKIYGWLDGQKKRWMVGWIEKIYEKKYGWLDG